MQPLSARRLFGVNWRANRVEWKRAQEAEERAANDRTAHRGDDDDIRINSAVRAGHGRLSPQSKDY